MMNDGNINFADELRKMIVKIRKLDPNAMIPSGETYSSYERAKELLYDLEHPAPPPLTPGQRAHMDADKLQNELSQRLGGYVTRGFVRAEDFPFPDVEGRDRLRRLQAFSSRLEEAKQEYTLSPEVRAKRTEREFREFREEAFRASNEMATKLVDAILRISAIEQELSNHG